MTDQARQMNGVGIQWPTRSSRQRKDDLSDVGGKYEGKDAPDSCQARSVDTIFPLPATSFLSDNYLKIATPTQKSCLVTSRPQQPLMR
jgi:hypothetical protein